MVATGLVSLAMVGATLGACDDPRPPAAASSRPVTSVSAASAPSARVEAPVELTQTGKIEGALGRLTYPSDGQLHVITQPVRVLPATLDPAVRAALCAEMAAGGVLTCGAVEEGATLEVEWTAPRLTLRGVLLVRTGLYQDRAFQLELAFEAPPSASPAGVARAGARSWLTAYDEGLKRHARALPPAVTGVTNGQHIGLDAEAVVVAGDRAWQLTVGNQKLEGRGTFFVLGATSVFPGKPAKSVQLFDTTPRMLAGMFPLEDAAAWDAKRGRLVLARGRSSPASAGPAPGPPCKSEDDCPGLTVVSLGPDADATIDFHVDDLTAQSGPVVHGDDTYVLGALDEDMFLVRVRAGGAAERTKIDLPVDSIAMRLAELGPDVLAAFHTNHNVSKRAVYTFSIAHGKVGVVAKRPIADTLEHVTPDGHGGLVAVGRDPSGTCKVVSIDRGGVQAWKATVARTTATCPAAEIAGDIVSLPNLAWFELAGGKRVGSDPIAAFALVQTGDLYVGCTEGGVGAWRADGAKAASVELPGGCQKVGAGAGGVLVVPASLGGYALTPPDQW